MDVDALAQTKGGKKCGKGRDKKEASQRSSKATVSGVARMVT